MSIATDTALMTRMLDKYSTDHVSVRERGITNNLVTLSSSVSNTDTALNAVVTMFNKGEVDGSAVLSTDLKVVADSAKAITKEDGDQLKIGSTLYRIVDVREIAPVGTVLGYIIQCRK